VQLLGNVINQHSIADASKWGRILRIRFIFGKTGAVTVVVEGYDVSISFYVAA